MNEPNLNTNSVINKSEIAELSCQVLEFITKNTLSLMETKLVLSEAQAILESLPVCLSENSLQVSEKHLTMWPREVKSLKHDLDIALCRLNRLEVGMRRISNITHIPTDI